MDTPTSKFGGQQETWRKIGQVGHSILMLQALQKTFPENSYEAQQVGRQIYRLRDTAVDYLQALEDEE